MSEGKWTKGPWRWRPRAVYPALANPPILIGAAGEDDFAPLVLRPCLARGAPDIAIRPEDAHLIAAAPELATVVLELSQALRVVAEDTGLETADGVDVLGALDRADAALARARRETAEKEG